MNVETDHFKMSDTGDILRTRYTTEITNDTRRTFAIRGTNEGIEFKAEVGVDRSERLVRTKINGIALNTNDREVWS